MNKHPLAWHTLDGPKQDSGSWAYKQAHRNDDKRSEMKSKEKEPAKSLFNQRHYKFLAEFLKSSRNNVYSLDKLAKLLAYKLRIDNPKFNIHKFLNACD